ncbi:hypothetical protein M9Y10_026708 [Tritrichomonas musculus]|uniref:Uncharacterized protein n=1 Tax=Tritrichomonas musculus TaxID=1915356 RepID=A0ABR2H6B7_9EUKA
MLSLNLKLHSISFIQDVVDRNGSIRMTIATFPDMQKQIVSLESKDLYNLETSIKLKYNESTNMIIIYFQKKGLFKDGEVFASGCIHSREIDENKNGCLKIEMREIIQQSEEKNNQKIAKARKIMGTMKINFSIKEIFEINDYGNDLSIDKFEQKSILQKFTKNMNKKANEEQYIFN